MASWMPPWQKLGTDACSWMAWCHNGRGIPSQARCSNSKTGAEVESPVQLVGVQLVHEMLHRTEVLKLAHGARAAMVGSFLVLGDQRVPFLNLSRGRVQAGLRLRLLRRLLQAYLAQGIDEVERGLTIARGLVNVIHERQVP